MGQSMALLMLTPPKENWSFYRLRESVLPSIIMADANLQGSDSLGFLKLTTFADMI